jgi:thermitase
MRFGLLVVAVMAAMLLGCTGVVLAQAAMPGSSPSSEDPADGEVLVKFEDTTPQAKKQEVHGKKGGRVKESIPKIGVQVVDVPKGKEEAKAKEYQDDPNVEFAEANGVYQALQTANSPNDSRADEQWQYNNAKYNVTNKGDIDAYEAWSGGSTSAWDGGTTGSSSVAIAVLDSGIREDHEDLQGKVTKRANYTDSSTNSDVYGHGTHVAGSVAANTDNQKGVSGTCPGCTLYNVKVLDDAGSGRYSWITNGLTWAADNGAKVINMSLGGPTSSSTVQAAIDYAWSKGVVVVAAAGNDGTKTWHYPAAYDNVIAVGATDNKDAKASFSNYGSSWVDVAAPGVDILSSTRDGGYAAWSGTSMATPHVAGVAGLVWSKSGLCDTTDNACVRNQIEATADPVSGTGTYWAKGRINANGGVSTQTSPPTDGSVTLTVRSKKPAQGERRVSRGTNVRLVFSKGIDQTTLTGTDVDSVDPTFALFKSDAKGTTGRRIEEAPVTYDPQSGTATLNPYGSSPSKLGKCRWFKAILTTGVKDEAGHPLAANVEWWFKTEC